MHKYEDIKNIISSYKCELLSEEYLGNNKKIKIKCYCGEIFETTFAIFNSPKRRKCPCCNGHKKRKEDVEKIIESKGCKLVSEYTNSVTNLKVQCVCGDVFEVKLGNFIRNNKNRCNQCSIGRKHKHFIPESDVIEHIESKGVKLLSKYVNCTDKLKLQCACGEIYYTNFNKFKTNNKIRCNKCTRSYSKIEILTEQYFKDNNVKYKTQITFKDLKVKSNVNLRFDFGIYDDKDSLVFLLELDGIQHFKSVEKFGGEKGFETVRKNDNLKKIYCEKNNIKLIRIPYCNFNQINDILHDILKYDNSVPSL